MDASQTDYFYVIECKDSIGKTNGFYYGINGEDFSKLCFIEDALKFNDYESAKEFKKAFEKINRLRLSRSDYYITKQTR